MRVATVTFQNADNYGALLQAFALQEILAELGHDVSVLDYRCRFLDERMYLPSRRGFTSKAKATVKKYIGRRRSIYKFAPFREEKLNLSQKYMRADVAKSTDCFDAFVVGSDQVWNPALTGFDTTYFLDFAAAKKRVAYAASFGVSDMVDSDLSRIADLVKGFDAIGMREQSGVELLKSKGLTNVEHVVDPVLLLDANKWHDLARMPHGIEGEFAFVYALGEPELLVEYAKKLRPDLPVVCLSKTYCEDDRSIGLKSVECEEFLGLICNAQIVVTNSFHGTCFAVLFGKDFRYSLHKDSGQNRSTRLQEFATTFGFEHLNAEISEEFTSAVDCGEGIESMLEYERKKSLGFLRNALGV